MPLAVNQTFTVLPRMPFPVYNPEALLVHGDNGDLISVIGGQTLTQGHSSQIQTYSISRNAWRRLQVSQPITVSAPWHVIRHPERDDVAFILNLISREFRIIGLGWGVPTALDTQGVLTVPPPVGPYSQTQKGLISGGSGYWQVNSMLRAGYYDLTSHKFVADTTAAFANFATPAHVAWNLYPNTVGTIGRPWNGGVRLAAYLAPVRGAPDGEMFSLFIRPDSQPVKQTNEFFLSYGLLGRETYMSLFPQGKDLAFHVVDGLTGANFMLIVNEATVNAQRIELAWPQFPRPDGAGVVPGRIDNGFASVVVGNKLFICGGEADPGRAYITELFTPTSTGFTRFHLRATGSARIALQSARGTAQFTLKAIGEGRNTHQRTDGRAAIRLSVTTQQYTHHPAKKMVGYATITIRPTANTLRDLLHHPRGIATVRITPTKNTLRDATWHPKGRAYVKFYAMSAARASVWHPSKTTATIKLTLTQHMIRRIGKQGYWDPLPKPALPRTRYAHGIIPAGNDIYGHFGYVDQNGTIVQARTSTIFRSPGRDLPAMEGSWDDEYTVNGVPPAMQMVANLAGEHLGLDQSTSLGSLSGDYRTLTRRYITGADFGSSVYVWSVAGNDKLMFVSARQYYRWEAYFSYSTDGLTWNNLPKLPFGPSAVGVTPRGEPLVSYGPTCYRYDLALQQWRSWNITNVPGFFDQFGYALAADWDDRIYSFGGSSGDSDAWFRFDPGKNLVERLEPYPYTRLYQVNTKVVFNPDDACFYVFDNLGPDNRYGPARFILGDVEPPTRGSARIRLKVIAADPYKLITHKATAVKQTIRFTGSGSGQSTRTSKDRGPVNLLSRPPKGKPGTHVAAAVNLRWHTHITAEAVLPSGSRVELGAAKLSIRWAAYASGGFAHYGRVRGTILFTLTAMGRAITAELPIRFVLIAPGAAIFYIRAPRTPAPEPVVLAAVANPMRVTSGQADLPIRWSMYAFRHDGAVELPIRFDLTGDGYQQDSGKNAMRIVFRLRAAARLHRVGQAELPIRWRLTASVDPFGTVHEPIHFTLLATGHRARIGQGTLLPVRLWISDELPAEWYGPVEPMSITLTPTGTARATYRAAAALRIDFRLINNTGHVKVIGQADPYQIVRFTSWAGEFEDATFGEGEPMSMTVSMHARGFRVIVRPLRPVRLDTTIQEAIRVGHVPDGEAI